MNSDALRLVIVVLNLGLISATGVMGYTIFVKRSEVPPTERVEPVDPNLYQVQISAQETRPIGIFAPIWKNFRTPEAPKPPPVAPKPTPVAPVEQPGQPGVVAQKYELVGASIYSDKPERSTCYLKKRGGRGGVHILLQVGEVVPETSLTLVALAKDGPERVKATVQSKDGKTSDIVLAKDEKKR